MNMPIQAELIEPVPGLTPGDLVEFGASIRDAGASTLESRALMGDLQQIAAQAVMAGTNKVLERTRAIQETRLRELALAIRMQSNALGYVRTDTVLALLAGTMNQTPQR